MPFVIPFIVAAVTAALVSAGVGAVTAGIIATIVVNAAVALAVTGLAALLQHRPTIAEQKENIRQAVPDRTRAYGRVKIGGAYAFLCVRTPWLYSQILLNTGLVDGFEEHWLGEYSCNLNDDGYVTSINGSSTPDIYTLDDGNNIARIEFRPGNATQAAYATLLTAFPETYTSAMQCKGVADALISLADPGAVFANRYSAGLPPYNAVLRASQVFDPRDETQSPTDPTTWKWTQNGVLIVMDYLWHPDGMRLPFSLIEPALDVWSAQADIADQVVPLADGGSEPRFQLSGRYKLTDPVKTVLPLMLDPMDARLGLRADGAIVIDTAGYTAPVDTITDGQIVSYIGLSRGRQKADIKNEFRAQFVSPDYLYVEAEADPWLNEASIDVDGLATQSLDLTWATSHREARVKMKIEAYRQDPDSWCGQIVTNCYGLKFLEPNPDGTKKRYMNFQIAELAINVPFEVQRFAQDVKTGQCTFTVIGYDGTGNQWDPATDEGIAPALPTAIGTDNIENPSSLTVTIVDQQVGGGSEVGILTASVPEPDQQGLNLRLQYAVHDDDIADGDKTWIDFTITGPCAGQTGPLAPNTYDVRAAFFNSRGHFSDYIYERGFIITAGMGSGGGGVPGTPTGL